jgi:fatty-acyl-CoA synthase
MWTTKQDRTFVDRCIREAERQPNQIAIVLDADEITYGDLFNEALAFAKAMVANNVTYGDHIGIFMPASRAFFAALLGSALSGARVVPINTRFRRRELSFIIAKAQLSGVITADLSDGNLDLLTVLNNALPELASQGPGQLQLSEVPHLRFVVVTGGAEHPGLISEASFLDNASAVADEEVRAQFNKIRREDTAVISFTSGTTSNPKGCLLKHDSLIRMWDAMASRMGMRRGDFWWVPAPSFHAIGYGGLGIAAGVGAATVTQSHFDAKTAARLIHERRPRIWYSPFPAVTDPVIQAAEDQGMDLSSVEVALYASPSAAKFDRLSAALPRASVIQLFGQTESTLLITLGMPSDPLEVRRAGCGHLFEGMEMRIVDPETFASVAPGEAGEIQYRGYNTFTGYFADPDQTAETILDGGWVRSGDSGRINGFGQLEFLGRLKDMLKVGGENVSALEVEAYLETHPAVKVAQVVAAPDARLLEVPCAFIERQQGMEVTEAELLDYCHGEIARYKIPKYVRFVDFWPMSTTKIRKADLRETIAAQLREVTQV